MNLVFLYGPPAVGKRTVGQALSEKTGYKLFDNHLTIEMLRQLFPFEDPALNLIRRRLQAKFRLEVFEEAAKAKVSFVTTCALAGPQYFDFYRNAKELTEKHGGRVLFVHLTPSKETMLQRVEGASRKSIKIESKDHLEQLLKNEPELFDTFPDEPHLQLDNTHLTPQEAAEKVIGYYKL